MQELLPGTLLKLKSKPNTYRVVQRVSDFYIYTKKPNGTPQKIPLTHLNRYEIFGDFSNKL